MTESEIHESAEGDKQGGQVNKWGKKKLRERAKRWTSIIKWTVVRSNAHIFLVYP